MNVPPLCIWCKHYDKVEDQRTCAAFPNGIPDEIIQWRVDHRWPVSGDNGIRFAKDPECSADDLAMILRKMGFEGRTDQS